MSKLDGKEEKMLKLDGKVAVVTGRSSGIGLATAKLFVKEGARVYEILANTSLPAVLRPGWNDSQRLWFCSAAAEVAAPMSASRPRLEANRRSAVKVSKSRVSKIRKSGRKTTDSAPWILSFWLLCFVTVAWGQDPVPKRPDRAALIANAESAAPEAIAKHATIVDWPAKPAGHFVMVRQGDNGWTCMPDRLDTPANDPMCMDAVWMEWMHAALEGRPAKIDRVGLAYMLQGGSAADQRDPFRTSPPPGKETYFVGPHIMVLLPDIKQLAGVSHDVYNGGPFVEALERDHPIILMPVAPPKTKLNVLPSDKPVLTNP